MNNTGQFTLMAERIESLKAGIIGGLCLLCALGLITAIAQAGTARSAIARFIINPYLQLLSLTYAGVLDSSLIFSAAIAGFSGFLFGVTYRYIIRQDDNPHLQSGAVMAFGLVRGLAQIDMGLNFNNTLTPAIILAIESLLGFFVTAKCLDLSIKWGWLKPFTANN
jgi:hypothetical protein